MNELDKLESYLKENGYEYIREDDNSQRYNKHQIIVFNNGDRSWDAICQFGSYGYEESLLEIYGDIVDEEKDGDSVVGWLTAEDVIQRCKQS